jgi:hypothetical protein
MLEAQDVTKLVGEDGCKVDDAGRHAKLARFDPVAPSEIDGVQLDVGANDSRSGVVVVHCGNCRRIAPVAAAALPDPVKTPCRTMERDAVRAVVCHRS